RPAAVGVHLPAPLAHLARVDGDDDALAAEAVGALVHQAGVVDRGGVDADLVGAEFEHGAHVGRRADAAANGEGDEHLVGGGGDHVVGRGAVLGGGGYVEEDKLVGALAV